MARQYKLINSVFRCQKGQETKERDNNPSEQWFSVKQYKR